MISKPQDMVLKMIKNKYIACLGQSYKLIIVDNQLSQKGITSP
jgi:hypothetical protein